MSRRTLLIAALGAATVLAVAGIADAVIPDSNGVYTACMLKSTGTIRLIDKSLSASSLLSHCTSLESELSWNKQGQAGTDGTDGTDGSSPTVAQLASGDANCPAGGASITDAANHVAYVCNGANGEDFAGTFTSPNGQYKLEVTDAGIKLEAPGGKVKLDASTAQVEGTVILDLKGGAGAKLESFGITEVQGPNVRLNGCNKSIAGVGDSVLVALGTGFGQILPPGSPTVCAG